MVTVVFAEPRSFIWYTLERTFTGVDGIELVKEDPAAFSVRRDLDAYVVNQWFAHERYGYEFVRRGVSEVLSTKGDFHAPPWIVTTPSFPIHLEPSETEDVKVARDSTAPSPDDEAYFVFSRIFEAVEHFNRTYPSRKIGRLGCDLEFISIAHDTEADTYERELTSIRKAYLEHRAHLANS